MNFDRYASSAQTPLIVFLAEKLNASLCFLFPKKPIGLFGDPENFCFIVHRTRFGDDAKKTLLVLCLKPPHFQTKPSQAPLPLKE